MKKVSIGFTGTAEGMLTWQIFTLEHLFTLFRNSGAECEAFHHGDCIGADAMAHDIACSFGHRIIIHPPIIDTKRANCVGDVILQAKEYIQRNHDIVDACDLMFATPKSKEEELRSGTWATIRYAQKKGKKLIIIWPDGTTLNVMKPVTNNA
jgi:hypothetical protein